MVALVTRPAENAVITIARLERLGLKVLHDPLLQVERLDTPMPSGQFSGVVITSVNAAAVLDRKWGGKREAVPVFTTGTTTANAMQQYGFELTMAIEGSALELVRVIPGLLSASNRSERLLYPCAETTAHDLPTLLAETGVVCEAWPCYRTIESADFSVATQKALAAGEVDFALLYSARTAACFGRIIQDCSLPVPCVYCLSKEICEALPSNMQADCRFPNVPSEDALMKILPNIKLPS